MITKWKTGWSLVLAVFLAAAWILAGAEESLAQRKGGGGGRPPGGPSVGRPPGGPGVGRPPSGGFSRPSYGSTYRGPAYPRYGYYYDAIGYSRNPFYNGYYSNLYPSTNYYSRNYYISPTYDYSYVPVYRDDLYYSRPSTQPSSDLYYSYRTPPSSVAAVTPVGNSVVVRVLLPDAQAKVWFDGNVTTQTGTERFFSSGQLDPAGGPYVYRVRASWIQDGEEMIQERVVSVTPGQTSVADFR